MQMATIRKRKAYFLQSVMGNGLCIGQLPPEYTNLCKEIQTPMETWYLIPLDNTRWACAASLTPLCLGPTLDNTQGTCVLVQLVPKISYYPKKKILYQLEPLGWATWEVFTAILVS